MSSRSRRLAASVSWLVLAGGLLSTGPAVAPMAAHACAPIVSVNNGTVAGDGTGTALKEYQISGTSGAGSFSMRLEAVPNPASGSAMFYEVDWTTSQGEYFAGLVQWAVPAQQLQSAWVAGIVSLAPSPSSNGLPARFAVDSSATVSGAITDKTITVNTGYGATGGVKSSTGATFIIGGYGTVPLPGTANAVLVDPFTIFYRDRNPTLNDSYGTSGEAHEMGPG
jgi:hypothetical protein